MSDLTLDFLEQEERSLVLKMLDAVVNYENVHFNRFMRTQRGGKWAYFVGQRGGNATPFPQYSTLNRDITGQLLFYEVIQPATAKDAPRGWFEFTSVALDWFVGRTEVTSVDDDKETGMPIGSAVDSRSVFVVHGRNRDARDAIFAFLRAIGLHPMEWSQALALTGEGSPYIGQVLDRAFEAAQAIVILMTPDDIAYLRPDYASSNNDPEREPTPQARPNVLFEAGLAFGRSADRTILVELGVLRPFSDIAGRHVIRMNNSSEKRHELARRLTTAGCEVDTSGTDWLSAGVLEPPPPPGSGLPLGRRLPTAPHNGVVLDASYSNKGKGHGTLHISNRGTVDILDLSFKIPEEAAPSFHVISDDLPIKKLPPGKSVGFPAIRTMGGGASNFEVTITGRTPDDEVIDVSSFISLMG